MGHSTPKYFTMPVVISPFTEWFFVHMCSTCIHAWVNTCNTTWVKGQPPMLVSPSILFETGSLCYLLLHTPGQVACKLLGCLLTDVCYHIWLHAGSEDPSSGSHAYLESLLLPDSCLQSQHTYIWPIVNDPIWNLLSIAPTFSKHLEDRGKEVILDQGLNAHL